MKKFKSLVICLLLLFFISPITTFAATYTTKASVYITDFTLQSLTVATNWSSETGKYSSLGGCTTNAKSTLINIYEARRFDYTIVSQYQVNHYVQATELLLPFRIFRTSDLYTLKTYSNGPQ